MTASHDGSCLSHNTECFIAQEEERAAMRVFLFTRCVADVRRRHVVVGTVR